MGGRGGQTIIFTKWVMFLGTVFHKYGPLYCVCVCAQQRKSRWNCTWSIILLNLRLINANYHPMEAWQTLLTSSDFREQVVHRSISGDYLWMSLLEDIFGGVRQGWRCSLVWINYYKLGFVSGSGKMSKR